jgi:predicted GNAT family acetyltransferase
MLPLAVYIMRALVDDVRAVSTDLPGVIGPALASHRFALAWQRAEGEAYHPVLSERLYQLDAAPAVQQVSGTLRRATDADHELLEAWTTAFDLELVPEESRLADVGEWVSQALAAPLAGIYLWTDSAPVAMAGYTGLTSHGAQIGPVYTPPEHRGRGYGSAVTASLSQLLLEAGRSFVYLLADATNTTSNRMYRRIGYRSAGAITTYTFGAGAQP